MLNFQSQDRDIICFSLFLPDWLKPLVHVKSFWYLSTYQTLWEFLMLGGVVSQLFDKPRHLA